MVNYIITRHPATIEWLKTVIEGETVIVPHLHEDMIPKLTGEDRVYGILPVHLIYRILRRGAEYYAIILPRVPRERRGQELTVRELKEYGAYIARVSGLELEPIPRGRKMTSGGGCVE